mgnify:CR=1 FL=1
MAVTGASPESRLRTILAAASTLTLIGIALAATGNPDLGAWLTLAGLIGLIYGLHRFGRTGPDHPIDLDPGAEEPDAP